jgi:streptogramin lyase
LGSGSGGVAIDGSGNVWSLNTGSSSVTEFTSKGTVTNGPYTDGGLSTPSALAIDGLDQVWIVNSTNSISVFNSSGTAISTTAYTGAGLSSPTSVAIDISGNLWIANSSGNSVTKVLGVAAPTLPLATGVANNTPAIEP